MFDAAAILGVIRPNQISYSPALEWRDDMTATVAAILDCRTLAEAHRIAAEALGRPVPILAAETPKPVKATKRAACDDAANKARRADIEAAQLAATEA